MNITSYKDVIWAFEQGEKTRENGNFLIAARYYRVAMIAYSHCEFPARDTLPPTTLEKIDEVCDNSFEQFHQMPGAIAQSPGREAALCRASLPKPCPASSIRAREGAGCGSVGAVSGA